MYHYCGGVDNGRLYLYGGRSIWEISEPSSNFGVNLKLLTKNNVSHYQILRCLCLMKSSSSWGEFLLIHLPLLSSVIGINGIFTNNMNSTKSCKKYSWLWIQEETYFSLTLDFRCAWLWHSCHVTIRVKADSKNQNSKNSTAERRENTPLKYWLS